VTATLTSFQVEVAEAFFAMPESQGFLLAGGAALLAQGLTDRPTYDLDLFTSPAATQVPAAREAFRRTAEDRGWTISVVRDHETFCRMVVADAVRQEVLVDLAVDSAPELPPMMTVAGPAFAPQELAGRKTVALFDRAEARDFADVFMLADRFGRSELLRWARDFDAGFDVAVFVQMLATLSRFSDVDLPVRLEDVPRLRRFFAGWAQELAESG
jgi:nucleotidyltransferase AbiEii toxin of type IV toxin-antitoxin system